MTAVLVRPEPTTLLSGGPPSEPPRDKKTRNGGVCDVCGHSLSLHNWESACVWREEGVRCPCDGVSL